MLYRKMPHTGDELSILGFGAMRLPQGKDGKIDHDRAVSQIRQAIDAGVNYVDTAWPYHGGQSEPLVGAALRDGYRDKVKLATKLPSWLIKSRSDMDDYLNRQLAKLETDRIDYYLLHGLNGANWANYLECNVADFLDKALADGRIGAAGFSFHGLLKDFKEIVDAYPWTFCQIQYNYLDREYQAGEEGLNYAADKGLGVIVMEPLRGGAIGRPDPPAEVAAVWQSAKVKRTPAEWGLRWVWNHPQVTVVLSGMNEEAHIEENLAAADQAEPNSLTEAERSLVEQAAAKYQDLIKVGCTACGYCLPCPEGVLIPAIFQAYNHLYMFKNEAEAKHMYTFRAGGGISPDSKPGYASQCVQCGECLEKCPQKLEIPDLLEEAGDKLEGDDILDKLAAIRKALTVD